MIKLLKIEANGLNIFAEDVNIDFYAEQRVFSDNNKMVSNVVNNIYANNVLSVVGVNASGKTTVLRLISLCIDYLNGKSLNNSSYTDIFTDSTEFNINVTFHIESKGIYKLFSEIKLHEDVKIDRRYIFKNEKLYFKKDTLIKTKKDILKFNESNLFRQRDDREEFLQDDISVVSALTKNSKVPVHNLLGSTNLNILRIVGDFPPELLNFLDPSIESIKFDDAGNEAKLKFYNRETISIANPLMFEHYLSSGTIKGIYVFIRAMLTFHSGGYMIVDELENHFNREIVLTLIRFFMDKKINVKGSTLIFSTHYSELLDEFERSDNIFITRNKSGISIQKLSDILKRNDIKKSEIFKSDYLGGTAPQYDTYIHFKRVMENCEIEED